MRAVEAENAEADRLIKRFDRDGDPDPARLSPERYLRTGKRMIAHRLDKWRRGRGIDETIFDRIERKEQEHLDRIKRKKLEHPGPPTLDQIIKTVRMGERVRKRVARDEADELLNKIVNEAGKPLRKGDEEQGEEE
jgi:hypothetical protein